MSLYFNEGSLLADVLEFENRPARNRSPIKIQKMKLTNKNPAELRPPKLNRTEKN
jgi:hypothetical protein